MKFFHLTVLVIAMFIFSGFGIDGALTSKSKANRPTAAERASETKNRSVEQILNLNAQVGMLEEEGFSNEELKMVKIVSDVYGPNFKKLASQITKAMMGVFADTALAVEIEVDEKGRRSSNFSFTTRYFTIIGPEDIVQTQGLVGNSGQNALLGSNLYTSGGIYRPIDVKLRPRTAPNGALFAGNNQPIKFPAARDNFFIMSDCTVTQVESPTVIKGHSCFITLCLGGGGLNCVNGLAAGAFRFDLRAFEQDKKGKPFGKLPPTFTGTILGGTGACAGIKGNFVVKSLTGQTPINDSPQFGLITQLITFNTNKKLPEAPGPQLSISNLAGQVTVQPTTASTISPAPTGAPIPCPITDLPNGFVAACACGTNDCMNEVVACLLNTECLMSLLNTGFRACLDAGGAGFETCIDNLGSTNAAEISLVGCIKTNCLSLL